MGSEIVAGWKVSAPDPRIASAVSAVLGNDSPLRSTVITHLAAAAETAAEQARASAHERYLRAIGTAQVVTAITAVAAAKKPRRKRTETPENNEVQS